MTKRKVYNNSRNNHRRPKGGKRNSSSDRDAVNSNAARNSDNSRGGRNQNSVLPDPTILQEYEYATEGAASRIVEMAEVEQDRRTAWEDDYIKFYKKSMRLGQLFGFLILISVVGAFVYLSSHGQVRSAEILVVVAFGAVALSSLFGGIGRRKRRRRR